MRSLERGEATGTTRASPIAVLAELEARALGRERPGESGAAAPAGRLIGLRCGAARLVTPVEQVREVQAYPDLALVPGTQAWLRGVSHIRGRLIPVVDLSLFLGGAALRPGRSVRMLAVEHAGLALGLLVDEVYGLKRLGRAPALAPPAPGEADGGAAPGEAWLRPWLSCEVELDGYRWGWLELHRVLESPALLQVERDPPAAHV